MPHQTLRRSWAVEFAECWRDRAPRIGPETAGLVDEIFEADDVSSPLHKAQCIVTHLDGFLVDRAEAASPSHAALRRLQPTAIRRKIAPDQGTRLRAVAGGAADGNDS